MEKKVDKEFLKFVKKKNKNKKAVQEEYEEEDIYEDEDDYEYLRLKRLSEPFNNLVKAKKKMSIEEIKEDESNAKSETVLNMLNKYKVINTKNYAKQNKDKSNKDEEQSESEENESEENESDDYEDDARINHFVKNKKHNDDDDVDSDINEELETIKEMKRFEKANIDDDEEDEIEDEENEDEDEDNKQIKKKKEKKEKKKKEKKNIEVNRNNTVFIKNLPSNITETDIESKFSKFGPIKTIRLVKDKNNNIKGFGYIDFETQKAMTSAIDASVKIKSNIIQIEKAKSSFIDEVPNKTLGRKKQRAMINKAKEQLKRKQKQIDNDNSDDDDDE